MTVSGSGGSGWLIRFVARYGWRAYALPMLALLTAVVVIDPARAGHSGPPINRAESRQSVDQPNFLSASGAGEVQAPVAVALGADTTPCADNSASRLILVNITQQRVWMCQRSVQVYSTLVTTGAENVGNGTPIGTWHVQDKQTNRYLVGPGYRDFVHYWMPFDGDFGFHDAPWQTMPYGAPGYVANGSHGCVHLPADAMSWLFQWAPTGTTVTIRA